jgi:hypothetical protein
MSVQRKADQRTTAGVLAQLALQPPQLDLITDPASRTHDVVASADCSERFIGRPWFVWKDNLELARMVNDRLACPPSR